MSDFLNKYDFLNDRSQEGMSKTDGLSVNVAKDKLIDAMTALKEQENFVMLLDHTAVDWLDKNKFELFYVLYSLKKNLKLRVCVEIDRDNPRVPSLSGLWASAEFQEREVLDLMGIKYQGHPDLRRLFLDDDWEGFPLRKDYKDDFMLELPDYVK